MKKVVVFVLLLSCLGATYAFKNENNPIFSLPAEQVCVVDDEDLSDLLEAESVHCGDLIFNYCTLQKAKENFEKIKNFDAIQLYFTSTAQDEVLKALKASITSEEFVDGLKIVNAYTPYFSKSVFVKSKKVNLQIASKDGLVVAGFPMLLTGY